MLGTTVVESQIGDANGSLSGGGKLNLCLLSGLTASLESALITHDINSTLGLELTNEEVLHLQVEVLTTEGGVTVGGLDLEDTSRDFEN